MCGFKRKGEIKQVQKRSSSQSKPHQTYVDSEMDDPDKPSAYDEEILEIEEGEEEEEDDETLLAAKNHT